MNSTRTLVRTPAYWLMVLVSAVSALLGAGLIVSKLPAMEAGLDDQTATTALVYGGQSWVVVGAALLGAGILGLVLALGVAAVRSAARPAAAEQPVEQPVAGADPATDAATLGLGEPVAAAEVDAAPADPAAAPPATLRS